MSLSPSICLLVVSSLGCQTHLSGSQLRPISSSAGQAQQNSLKSYHEHRSDVSHPQGHVGESQPFDLISPARSPPLYCSVTLGLPGLLALMAPQLAHGGVRTWS